MNASYFLNCIHNFSPSITQCARNLASIAPIFIRAMYIVQRQWPSKHAGEISLPVSIPYQTIFRFHNLCFWFFGWHTIFFFASPRLPSSPFPCPPAPSHGALWRARVCPTGKSSILIHPFLEVSTSASLCILSCPLPISLSQMAAAISGDFIDDAELERPTRQQAQFEFTDKLL